MADASVVVAALIGAGERADWARQTLSSSGLVAPHLLPVEVLSAIRKAVARGRLSVDVGTLAVGDLEALRVRFAPLAPLARRVWELRDNLTPYDAWYVALAEALEVPLATLDERLARSQHVGCSFLLPADAGGRRGRLR